MAVDTATSDGVGSTETPGGHLQRKLTNRHITMISLGGAIGVGLFYLSGSGIHAAGPSLLLTYLVAGAIVFMVVRGLGELAVYRPVTGSLAAYATEFIGPRAGFFTGWTYWLTWVIAGMAEITAVSYYVHQLAPTFPGWITSALVLLLFYGCNLVSVKMFGESEFWFSMLKIVAIIGIIIIGIAVIVFGLGKLGDTASFTHLWDQGGFFPKGVMAPVLTLQFAIVAFYGLELVGVTAGEVDNPEKTLPKAINSIGIRIIFCYVGALAIIMSLVAWSEFDSGHSPFLLVFNQLGIPAAAVIINVIVISAAFSAGNTTVFCTGRMLYALADAGHAPKRFAKISPRNGVPITAITASAIVMSFAVALKFIVPEQAFLYVTGFSALGDLAIWFMIAAAHLGYMRATKSGRLKRGKFRMPWAPYSNYIIMVLLVAIAVMLWFRDESRVAIYVAPIWLAAIFAGWLLMNRRKSANELAALEASGLPIHAERISGSDHPREEELTRS